MTHRSLLFFAALLLALLAAAPISAATPHLGHACEDEIASTKVFLRLTLLQGTVWNAAFHNLQPPYDYSAGQLGLEMLGIDYPISKLDTIDAYLDTWNIYGNVDNWQLQKVTAKLRPYLRTLAMDLGQAC